MRKPATSGSVDISPERLQDLKENAKGILAECRRHLMNRQPFVGSIAMNLDIIPTRDARNPTAATDGKAIYFDISFLSTLTNDYRVFVLAHEIWHNVMLHFIRTEGRDKDLFNVATDLEVNNILRNDGFNIPPMALLPEKYGFEAGKSAEEYYELLLKKQKYSNSSSSGGSSSSGSSSGQNSSSQSNGNDNSQDQSQGQNKSGNKDGKLEDQFDVHIYDSEDMSKQHPKEEVCDKYGKVGEDEDFAPEVKDNVVEKIREIAISAAQQQERRCGTLPAHIAKLVEQLLTPEISWKEVLAQFVTRSFGDKRQWNPPNRRHVWHDSYLQSRRSEKLKIAVGIDTSGSIGSYINKFLTELNSLVNTFGKYELHVIQCDTEVDKYDLYTEDDPLDVETNGFKTYGGGGTRLTPIFEYIIDNALDIDAAIIFTDGYVSDNFTEDKAPEFPVLWMLTNDGTQHNIHFGEVHIFKE